LPFKKNIKEIVPKLNNFNALTNFQNLADYLFFNKFKGTIKVYLWQNKLLYKPERHKYLKTKTQFLLSIMKLKQIIIKNTTKKI
jgi:hypothetical protein